MPVAVRCGPVLVRLAALLLTGCRLYLDPVAGDAATADAEVDAVALAGHDDDGDGIDDAIDVCPHIADAAQADADGDRVGDACDPNPAVATESIVVFDPFVALRGDWRNSGDVTPTFDGTDLVADARGGVLRLARDVIPAADVFELGGTLGARGTMQEQLAVSLLEAAPSVAHYYCELYDSGMPKFALSYSIDNVTFPQIDQTPAVGPFENAPFMVRMTNVPPADAICVTSWPTTAPSVGGTVPPETRAPTRLTIYSLGVEVRWSYFIQIRTTP